jgi:uncharacterized protein
MWSVTKILRSRKIVVSAFMLGVGVLLLSSNWPTFHDRRQAALIAAALAGNTGRMKLLLVLGADPEEPACDTTLCPTPLIAASMNGNPAAVELLLERGANVNGRMKRGQTALIAAAYKGHCDVVNVLVSRGANVNADWEGCTAIKSASQRGHSQIVDVLSDAGAVSMGRCDD